MHLPLGRIVKGIGGFYYVKSGMTMYECKARGLFRKNEIIPLPGDMVNFVVTDEAKSTGFIEEIVDRRNSLIRPAVANIDQLAAVIAVKSPDPDLLLLDKLLISASIKDISAFICINKVDLDDGNSTSRIKEAYEKAGYEVVKLNSLSGEGYEDLNKVLKGKTTVFAGQSGVGKSTILNRLMKKSIMATGSVSEKIKRGRHTTRHAELVEMSEETYIVDTPGFSSYDLMNMDAEQLQFHYNEFCDYINNCRFSYCSHVKEPQCAVKEALDEGIIDYGRYSRYTQLYNQLKQNKTYRK